MPKKLQLNEKRVLRLYEKGDNINQIAKKLDVSYTAIRNCLLRNGVQLRKQGLPPIELPKDLGEGSLRSLAKKYGVSYQTIANRKKEQQDG